MTTAEWDDEYARLARAASQLRTSGSSGLTGNHRDAQAKSLLQGLDRLLAGVASLQPPSEQPRRRRLVESLKQQVMNSGSGGASAGDSTGYSGGATGANAGGATGGGRVTMALRQQDDMIDELAVGVGRLKNQTQLIQDEATMHVNLLGDMEANVDLAQQGMEAETRRAKQIKEDQSVWRLQLAIAGLSVLLFLLILAGLS